MNSDVLVDNFISFELPDQEPQIAFHINSEYTYNDEICYGFSDKAELLRALGIEGKWQLWDDNVQ